MMRRIAAVALAAGLVPALLVGCQAMDATPEAAPVAMVPVELQSEAVGQLGFADELAADGGTASPSPRAGDRGKKHRALRRQLRRDALHGEATVKTKNGTATIVAQRGEVAAATTRNLTVRSADGYRATYAVDDATRFVVDRRKADRDDVRTGDTVGVVGKKSGDETVASLVVVPRKA